MVPLFLLPSHRPRRNRETLPIWKLYHNTEESPPRGGFTQNIIDRVFSGSLGTLNPCLTKTNRFNFFGLNAVTGNVSDSIWRPDELPNAHALILHRTLARRRPNTAEMGGGADLKPEHPFCIGMEHPFPDLVGKPAFPPFAQQPLIRDAGIIAPEQNLIL